MSALKRFSPAQFEALKRGRAIPFLIEHRDPALPDHTLSVIGQIDDGQFFGLFLPDDDPECELVDVPITGLQVEISFPIVTDSADAQAIHRLWTEWNGGVRQAYLELSRLIGRVLARARLLETLDVSPADREPPPDAPTPSKGTREQGARTKIRKRRTPR